ncbi:MAG: RNA polymerase sigma factor [Chloroflexi bacterium]|nr:RNA polymerase sigma factor [Chloroflexota bacterium]
MNQSNYEVSLLIKGKSEKSLVQLAGEGNLDAFTTLYDHYLPAVYKRVWYSVPRQDVDDVTQNVFINVLKSIQSFRGDAKFSTWLRTITNRQIANYYRQGRRTKKEIEWSDIETKISDAPNQLTNTAREDEMIYLRQGLDQLKDDYREIILLRFAEGLKFVEIAEFKGLSLEAVKSRYRRAISTLRTELGDSAG